MLTVSKKDLEVVDWANMPMDQLAFGNAIDCDFTRRAYFEIDKILTRDGRPAIYDKILKDVLVDFSDIEFRGVAIDESYLGDLEIQLRAALAKAEATCIEMSPIKDFNIRSTQDLTVILYTTQGFNLDPVEWSKLTKLPSCNADSLELIQANLLKADKITELEEKALKFIEAILEWRSRQKQFSTYVTSIRKAIEYNGFPRNFPQYNFSTVVTGRLSCSNYTVKKTEFSDKNRAKQVKYIKGVGFHTLPRIDEEDPVNIRKLFIADPGMLFITADFSTAELRMLAFLSKDENLKKAFYSGADLHKYTASLIFSKDISQISKEERQIAKSVSFLIVYGGGPRKLSMQIGKSLQFCKGIFNKFFTAFPGIPRWIEETRGSIRRSKESVSLFGRKRHLINVTSPAIKYVERALRQGVNHKIQSPVSDMLLVSTYRINRMVEKAKISMQTLANVHDSYEGQVTKEDLIKAILIIRKGMTDLSFYKNNFGLDIDVPFTIDIEVGHSFGSGIQVLFDGNGSIINKEELLAL